MKQLTKKEEEIMTILWEKGPMLVKEIQEIYEEPKPHVNTISTIIRILEDKGFISHKSLGKTYQYFPLMSRDEYRKRTLSGLISKYFDDSYLEVVSSFIKKEEISIAELKELIAQVEKNNN
ncbi:BlaI/MecI/CopY family transcriptional regulator [Dysgonomonas sp. Marseille-P4361]|uniref:BlaI/MecI/CopY family transcriptional regulator n=1 Tax=Dysgonomonas sp. Marseille-P4361 TaxID=2161820 RepID=UPI000D55A05D|nr:BlaI/MecI/CopY family transcriptional regulator [Dysgonomonas sp. Marseille-P4361]